MEGSKKVNTNFDDQTYSVTVEWGSLVRFMEFGNIEGLEVGTILQSREEMGARGYHNPRQKGIWGASKTGSCSIVLSEGYEDDIDEIDYIKYTGQGGRNSNSKKQIAEGHLVNRTFFED